MPLPRAPLLLLGAVLGSFVDGLFCGSLTHSLWYLPESEHNQGLPQSFIRGYLDDQPIARYDSLTGKMEPLVPWMEEVEKARFEALEWVFGADLEKLSDLNHQTGGPHNWQVNWGCELWEDGSKRGFLHYGYDGRDFISFDKETLRWVAAQPQAQKVKEKWEDHPGWAQRKETYLEKTCIEWLQRYLSYRKEAPQRIEPPVGKVTHKMVDDSLEVLICQAFGFYPQKIQATWTRDGEVCEYETLSRNVAPNSDGTYYVWLSIEIDPKERDRFRCRLEHQGLQEPLILAWKEETAKVWWTCMAIVAASILGVGIFFLIHQWRRYRNNLYQEETTCHNQTPSQSVSSFSMYYTKDEMQSVLSLQTSLHKPSYGLQRTQSDPEITGSLLHRREVKPGQNYKTWTGTDVCLQAKTSHNSKPSKPSKTKRPSSSRS